MSPDHYRRVRRKLMLIIVTANLCGVGLLVFYFNSIYGGAVSSPLTGSWLELGIASLLTGGLLVLGNRFSGRWLDAMWAWYRQATTSTNSELAPAHIRRLALNMPAISAGTTLVMWVLGSLGDAALGSLDSARCKRRLGRSGQRRGLLLQRRLTIPSRDAC